MLATSRDGGVMRIVLNRPERRNALGTEMILMLERELGAADADPAIGAVVLAGAPPVFCAGSDLKELAGMSPAEMCAHEAATAAIARSMAHVGKPLLAAVEGAAIGGGFFLAIACDLVVTATNTKWSLPEVAHGWVPPWGLQALVDRVGPSRARLLTWGLDPLDGSGAQRAGLADFVTEPGEALGKAHELAERYARLPAAAVRSTKHVFAALTGAAAIEMDLLANQRFGEDLSAPAALTKFESIRRGR